MKRYWYLPVVLLAIIVVGGLWMRHQKRELELRMQADIQQMQQQWKEKTGSIPVDLLEVHEGDTTLVAACSKSFFISSEGITDIQADPSLEKDYIRISRPENKQFELRFSCESIKRAPGIYPFLVSTNEGKKITIYFIPMSDLNGQLKYHSNFKVRQ